MLVADLLLLTVTKRGFYTVPETKLEGDQTEVQRFSEFELQHCHGARLDAKDVTLVLPDRKLPSLLLKLRPPPTPVCVFSLNRHKGQP